MQQNLGGCKRHLHLASLHTKIIVVKYFVTHHKFLSYATINQSCGLSNILRFSFFLILSHIYLCCWFLGRHYSPKSCKQITLGHLMNIVSSLKYIWYVLYLFRTILDDKSRDCVTIKRWYIKGGLISRYRSIDWEYSSYFVSIINRLIN